MVSIGPLIKAIFGTPPLKPTKFEDFLLVLLVLADVVLTAVVIWKVPYTEIDWIAYMQEVEGFLNGTLDYSLLRGDTGPLVYPAGFVYVYSGLYHVTDHGQDIPLAQLIFAAIYIAVLILCLLIYRKSRSVPLAFMGALILSKRVHSIFVLRLFNDGIAMLLLYTAIYLFTGHHWRIGCFFYSLAVGVKMNILLFSPGLLLLLIQCNPSLWHTFVCLSICAGVQLALGWPFLVSYPLSYLKGSFDLGRVFMFRWTVNWKFLDEETFVGKPLAIGLLVATLLVWTLYFYHRWSRFGPHSMAVRVRHTEVMVRRAAARIHALWREGRDRVIHPSVGDDRMWQRLSKEEYEEWKSSPGFNRQCVKRTNSGAHLCDLDAPFESLPPTQQMECMALAQKGVILVRNKGDFTRGSVKEVILAESLLGGDPSLRSESATRDAALTKIIRVCKAVLAEEIESERADLVRMSPEYITTTLFASNFIGIAFARSLHYQFYCWYFHQLPYLVCQSGLPKLVGVAILLGIEVAFNVFPATPESSLLLQGCHALLIVGLFLAKTRSPYLSQHTIDKPKAD